MQTSKTGRYPWLFHFCRGQAERLTDVVIYARLPYPKDVLASPPRDWRTKESIQSDYRSLLEHGGKFNDTKECLES